MAIRELPPLVVNQIAAGEVVERPASVVKELVENAIDAAATRVDIEIEGGGRDLIKVSDDGAGIAFEELALAVAAHATSKITGVEDLDAIATLGFRGEALASIGAVSRMSLVSRPAGAVEAGRLDAAGDDRRGPRPEPGPHGTTITVRNLFFNTPARRKFLRTEQTETGRVTQAVEALALGHTDIGFTLTVNGRRTLDLPPDQGQRRRILFVLGRELEPELLPFSFRETGLSLSGLAGRPGIARGTARHQHLFLNGRAVTDKSIAHAIKEAYRGLIDPGRYPTIVLFLELDPRQVDVNVHPAKAEVRFRHPQAVHSAVLNAVRQCLRDADLVPSVALPDAGRSNVPDFGAGTVPAPTQTSTTVSTSGFVEHFRQLDPVQKGFIYSEVREALAAEAPEILGDDTLSRQEVLPTVRQALDVLQVHSSFLVTQDEQGLLIIDQHALHERVMFETLLEAVDKGNLESQRLLMPTIIDVDRSQLDLLEQLQPLLARIGIEAEQAGPTAIAIHAFSSFLFERNVEPGVFMSELFDRAAREGVNTSAEAALHETLDMMACKAAIKAGDRLSPEEIADLLKQREKVERSSNCPHGRPTTIRLSIKDLEKQFGRR